MDQEELSERPVRVTAAEERPHPALLKLARACIALAQLEKQPPADGTRDGDEPPAAAGEVSP